MDVRVDCSGDKESRSIVEQIDLDKITDRSNDVPRYIADGIGINDHDIATLEAGVMMEHQLEYQCGIPIIRNTNRKKQVVRILSNMKFFICLQRTFVSLSCH